MTVLKLTNGKTTEDRTSQTLSQSWDRTKEHECYVMTNYFSYNEDPLGSVFKCFNCENSIGLFDSCNYRNKLLSCSHDYEKIVKIKENKKYVFCSECAG